MAREIKNSLLCVWGLGVGEGEGDGRGFTCVSHVALSLFVPHPPSFGATGGLCFVIVAFPWYIHLYVCGTYNIRQAVPRLKSKVIL